MNPMAAPTVAAAAAVPAAASGSSAGAAAGAAAAKAPAKAPAKEPVKLPKKKASKPGELGVVVVRASGLAVADSGKDGTSDPFAKVVVQCAGKKDQTKKTKVKKDTVDPVWNESFAFSNVLD